MTPQELAQKLNGRECGDEITKQEEKQAKAAGLVVVFGYSDDNIEFRGAINEEVGMYDGGVVHVSRDKVFSDHECDCEHCTYHTTRDTASKIDCKWCENDYSWFISADFPHATFDIMEDDEKFSRGIVYSVNDVPVTQNGAMFLVGMYREGHENWEFVGIYTERDTAIANCLDYQYFVAPVIVNETAPENRTNWDAVFYPHKMT